tara:strand:- start:39 stop:317 length:279 start_codon:yes stop_codon:yes gene_type:complete
MNNKEDKINQNLNEEHLVSDLKKSLDNTIQEASVVLNELIQNIESTVQDNEIRDRTKEIVKTFSEDLRNFLQQASDHSVNEKKEKKFSKEEE